MKKRVALEDKKDWNFDLAEPVVYFNDQKVYPAVQDLMITNFAADENGLNFDISEISLPNLKHVIFIKVATEQKRSVTAKLFEKLSIESFYNVKELLFGDFEDDVELHGWVSNCINLESVELDLPEYYRLPFDLSNSMKIRSIKINSSKISQIPDFVFNCKQLESLQFISCSEIREISDEIKKLVNLKSFWLWKADFKYVSPELFKLPKLKAISLSGSSYKNPPYEIQKAIQELKERTPGLSISLDRDSWFRKIWDQV